MLCEAMDAEGSRPEHRLSHGRDASDPLPRQPGTGLVHGTAHCLGHGRLTGRGRPGRHVFLRAFRTGHGGRRRWLVRRRATGSRTPRATTRTRLGPGHAREAAQAPFQACRASGWNSSTSPEPVRWRRAAEATAAIAAQIRSRNEARALRVCAEFPRSARCPAKAANGPKIPARTPARGYSP